MKKHTILTVSAVILFALSPLSFADLIYNDGIVHNIDFQICDNVFVHDRAVDEITTLNLIPNGNITGTLGGFDNSQLTVAGGVVNDSLNMQNNSQLAMSSGTVGKNLEAYGNSMVTLTGGKIKSLLAFGTSEITLSGGGVRYNLYSKESSNTVISGGVIGLNLFAEDSSHVTITGGKIGDTLYANHDSAVIIYGSSFNYDFGKITTSIGFLIGTLANGDIINNIFIVSDKASITLVSSLEPPRPPEPTVAPVANAGGDIIADANQVVVLNGNASYDTDGYIVEYTWTALPEEKVLYSGPETACTTKALGKVEEVIKLTVTDDKGSSSEDTVSIFSKRIEDIELTPGPEGPQGIQGVPGEQGLTGIQGPPGITPAEIAEIQTQITILQQQFALLQQMVEQNRQAMEQFNPLRKLLDELGYPQGVLGDINYDGKVDLADLEILTSNWLESTQ